MTTYEQLLADCIRWAKEAGRIQLELFRSDRLDIEAKFNDSDVVTNADKASEKDVKKCIAIGLPAGDVRAALNLKDHPENRGKKVTVKGTISTVYKIPGVIQPTAFKF